MKTSKYYTRQTRARVDEEANKFIAYFVLFVEIFVIMAATVDALR